VASVVRALKGHVDLVGLGSLLQLLSHNACEGILSVRKGNDRQAIYFSPGAIRLLSSTLPRVKRIGRIAKTLLGPTTISPERLRALLRREKLLGWTLGQLALTAEPLREDAVRDALRQQVEEEVLDLFFWAQASFDFSEARFPRATAGNPLGSLALHANVTSLLLEAARRADELAVLRQTLTDDSIKILKLPREIYADELGEDVVRVDAILPLLNGRRTLRSVLRASIYPRFPTMRAVHKLLSLGYVKVHDRQGQTVQLTVP